MGPFPLSGRVLRQIAILLTLLISFSAWAGPKRYLVILKSDQDFKTARQMSQRPMRSASGKEAFAFLGTRAAATNFLDHVKMVVIESNQRSTIEALEKHPMVAVVEEEYFFDPPKMPQQATVEPYIFSQRSELPWGLEAIKAPGAWTITKGENSKVLVLDSGLDVTHPDLKGRFVKGKSFMGDSLEDKIGHGTHVSGTVLADGASGLFGVAPEAKLLMAKVCDMTCSSVGIAEGVNWGIAEKVDVMNLSLGGPFLFPSQQQAYKNAEAANVVVVAAAGNSGSGSLSYPAALATVLSVGAVTPTLEKASFSQYGPTLDVVAPGVQIYSSLPVGTGRASLVELDMGSGPEKVNSTGFQNSDPGSVITTGDLVYAGLGKEADFVGKDLNGKIALIQRGEITFEIKVTNARNAGAIGVVIFNNEEGLITGGLETQVSTPVVMIEKVVGESVLQNLAKKTISAALSMQATDYGDLQGTSMASPHVAGLAALVRSVNKQMTAAQVRELIRSSATPLLPNPNNQLGRGLVNAEAAVQQAREALAE